MITTSKSVSSQVHTGTPGTWCILVVKFVSVIIIIIMKHDIKVAHCGAVGAVAHPLFSWCSLHRTTRTHHRQLENNLLVIYFWSQYIFLNNELLFTLMFTPFKTYSYFRTGLQSTQPHLRAASASHSSGCSGCRRTRLPAVTALAHERIKRIIVIPTTKSKVYTYVVRDSSYGVCFRHSLARRPRPHALCHPPTTII